MGNRRGARWSQRDVAAQHQGRRLQYTIDRAEFGMHARTDVRTLRCKLGDPWRKGEATFFAASQQELR